MKVTDHKQKTRQQPAQQVRIIGGQWKRTPLPVAHVEGLRPTPDRVRETAFNWIGHQLGGNWQRVRCLDLFAGSGALGFEAASRGAAQVTLVEASPEAWRNLETIKTKLDAGQVTIVRGDALRFAQMAAGNGQRFDVIFLDPPYQADLLPKILPLCADLLAEDGLVYAESAQPFDRRDGETAPEFLAGWEIIRSDHAGMVFYCLLKR
ncbi:MAG: 16S rRNA (guanine(966)-N(2))-methyltransferase RsmD [Burkholderiaceae bacterium]|nr:16S rRNA (guanine(966)-N(2))-methyltransferase RsmD [Burkholderiaceae bacterium]